MFSLIVLTIEWYIVVPLGQRNTPHLLRLKTFKNEPADLKVTKAS